MLLLIKNELYAAQEKVLYLYIARNHKGEIFLVDGKRV